MKKKKHAYKATLPQKRHPNIAMLKSQKKRLKKTDRDIL